MTRILDLPVSISTRLTAYRYTRRLRSGNNVIDRPRLHSVNDVLNTSSNSKQPLNKMKTPYQIYSRASVLLPTNASCFATKTHYWRESCSRKVWHLDICPVMLLIILTSCRHRCTSRTPDEDWKSSPRFWIHTSCREPAAATTIAKDRSAEATSKKIRL